MELWLRYRSATRLEFDDCRQIQSQSEWFDAIDDRKLISSVLWPTEFRFGLTMKHMNRHHPHELDYLNDQARNLSYRLGCE